MPDITQEQKAALETLFQEWVCRTSAVTQMWRDLSERLASCENRLNQIEQKEGRKL